MAAAMIAPTCTSAITTQDRAMTASQRLDESFIAMDTRIASYRLENTDLDVQILLGILLDLREQAPQLGDGTVHVVVQLLVLEQLAGRALALVEGRHQRVQALDHGIQPIIEPVVGQQLAGRAF